jgi:DNA-binding response OmpR family regulator
MSSHVEKIFLIEDDLDVSRMYERAFRLYGYEIEIAHDGETALERLSQKDVLPDAIIMDVMVPFMDGFQLLERFRGDARLSKIPVAILTNSFHKEDEQRFLGLGAKLYMVKIEHQSKQVVEKVEQLIREHNTGHADATILEDPKNV